MPSPPTPHTVTSSALDDAARIPASPAAARMDHETRYVLGAELGRGGLGRVTRAEDRALGRVVAIKELHDPSPGARARFQREIELTARLQHPAIVPVYDAGAWKNEEPFYAMRLVGGGTLKAAIEGARTWAERVALLPHVITVADAIAYAHRQGIVHRDLKPSNVLIGEHGETLVVDWGAAKDLREAAAPPSAPASPSSAVTAAAATTTTTTATAATPGAVELSRVGAVIGTPAFMAPEQARGERASKAADIYALGALLYNVLAGHPPYRGDVDAGVVVAQPPAPLAPLVPDAPEPLVAIADLAMARDPRQRYQSADEVAADLRRFQTGQLVAAHRYSALERVARLLQRHRAASAVGALALVVIAAVSAVAVNRVVHERDVAAERSRELTLLQASTALEHDPTAALAWLDSLDDGATARVRAKNDDERMRAIAADALTRGVARDVVDMGAKVEHLAVAPGGRFAYVAIDHELLVWDVKAHSLAARWPADDPLQIRFNASGSRAVTRGRQGTLRVFPGVKGDKLVDEASAPIRTFTGDHASTASFAIFHGSDRAVLASADGGVRVFDLASTAPAAGEVVARHPGGTGTVDVNAGDTLIASGGETDDLVFVDAVAARPDGTRAHAQVAVGAPISYVRFAGDGALLVVRLDGGVSRAVVPDAGALDGAALTLAPLTGHGARVDELAFNADRSRVAIGFHDGAVVVEDVDGGHAQTLLGHTNELVALAWSSDGARVASAGLDKTVRVWELAHGTARVLHGHRAVIDALAFADGDRALVSGGQDENVRVWDVSDDGRRRFPGHTEDIYSIKASPDGSAFATTGKDRTVRLWDRASGAAQIVATLGATGTGLAFSPDATWLAASGWAPAVDAWPLARDAHGVLRANLEDHRALTGHDGSVWRVEVSRDGKWLASASGDGTVRAWATSALAGAGRVVHTQPAGANSVNISPDSTLVASAGVDGSVLVSSIAPRASGDGAAGDSGATISLHAADERIARAIFSPDGAHIAVPGVDGALVIFDAHAAGAAPVKHIVVHEGPMRSLAWIDDDHVLTGGDDGRVAVVDLAHDTARVLGRHAAYVRDVAPSPDRALFASLAYDQSVRVFDAATGVLVGLVHADAPVLAFAWTPDSSALAIVGYEKVVDVVPRRVLAVLPTDPVALARMIREATRARITEDGEPLSATPLARPQDERGASGARGSMP